MSEEKKTFRERFQDSAVGRWAAEKFPAIKDLAVDALPDKGVLGIVKNLLDNDSDELSPEQKLEFQKELNRLEEIRVQEILGAEKEASERWKSDNSQDLILPRITRPLLVIYMTVVFSIIAVLDSCVPGFEVKDKWSSIIELVWLASVNGYFIIRSVDKRNRAKYSGNPINTQ